MTVPSLKLGDGLNNEPSGEGRLTIKRMTQLLRRHTTDNGVPGGPPSQNIHPTFRRHLSDQYPSKPHMLMHSGVNSAEEEKRSAASADGTNCGAGGIRLNFFLVYCKAYLDSVLFNADR